LQRTKEKMRRETLGPFLESYSSQISRAIGGTTCPYSKTLHEERSVEMDMETVGGFSIRITYRQANFKASFDLGSEAESFMLWKIPKFGE